MLGSGSIQFQLPAINKYELGIPNLQIPTSYPVLLSKKVFF